MRPPAFAKDFHRGDGSFFFRHVIEPYLIYRKISGINNFDRIIRFDYIDAIADTNEIEFGIANRFFTRRSTENVSDVPVKDNRRPEPSLALEPAVRSADDHAARQILFRSVLWRRLAPGPAQSVLSDQHAFGFSYGGVPRRFSPVNVDARYRPRRDLFVDLRTDLDTHGGGMRSFSTTFGLNRPLIQVFQSFYYTRAIELVRRLSRDLRMRAVSSRARARLAVESVSVSREPRAGFLWRRVVLLRLSEATRKGRQFADQLDRYARP